MHCSKKIVRIVSALVSGVLISVSAFALCAETIIKVGSYQDHVPEIRAYIAQHGCQSLTEAELGQNQILSEYLIFCNALKLADTDYRIKLYSYPLNARVLDDLESGFLDASAVGIWRNELQGKHYQATTALLQPKEFVKGFYTTQARLRELSGRSSLHGNIVLANSNWFEWRMLTCSGLKTVHVNQYKNMFRMLSAKRGDLIPLTFSNKPELERYHFNVRLYPVPGFKLAFDDSTHFAVRAAGDTTNALLTDLNTGLKQLRAQGLIENVYRRLGIINPAVDSWKPVGRCND